MMLGLCNSPIDSHLLAQATSMCYSTYHTLHKSQTVFSSRLPQSCVTCSFDRL